MNAMQPGSHDDSRQASFPDKRGPDIRVMEQNRDKQKNLPSPEINRRWANHEHVRRAERNRNRNLSILKAQGRRGIHFPIDLMHLMKPSKRRHAVRENMPEIQSVIEK